MRTPSINGRRHAIMAHLVKGPATAMEIREALGSDKSTRWHMKFDGKLWECVKAGHAWKHEDGRYELTPAGAASLESLNRPRGEWNEARPTVRIFARTHEAA